MLQETESQTCNTFVVDHGFPSHGMPQGLTVLVDKEMETQAIITLMVPRTVACDTSITTSVKCMVDVDAFTPC